MALVLGKSGVNKDLTSIYQGVSGVNKASGELYFGKSGVNKQIYSNTIFTLASVPIDNVTYSFSKQFQPNSLTVSIYSTGHKIVGGNQYGATELNFNCLDGISLTVYNMYDKDIEEGEVYNGGVLFISFPSSSSKVLECSGSYNSIANIVITFSNEGIIINGVTTAYTSLGITRPTFVSYSASKSADVTSGSITNLVIK